MKKVIKFVKGKKEEKKESVGITPSTSGELLSPAQTPEDEKFLGLDTSSGYIVDFCGKDKTLTKLHKAAWQGSLDKLKSALKKLDIDAVDRHNRTALHFAVAQGHPNIVWFLLGNNAKTTICDDEGHTPLLKAIECGHKECMALLLERGVDLNVADYTGNTGLHIATKKGSLDTVSSLLSKGADTEISNNAGDYPLHIATKLENKDLIDSLLKSGASVDVLDRENRTPLMLAAKCGNLELVHVFFERGAQLTIVDSNGWTAEDYALLSGYENVASSLRSLLIKKTESKPVVQETKEEVSVKSNENSGSWSTSQGESSEAKDPITKKLKEFFKQCSREETETAEKEKEEDLSESPSAEVMPPYCRPPRSWEIIQAGMIDGNQDGAEPKRRSITTLGTLHSRRESFTEGLAPTSPKYTLSLNRRKDAKVNSFAKQRFSFNEAESLKNWINEDKTIRKDLEKIELENMLNLGDKEMEGASSKKRHSTSESDWDSDVCVSVEKSESKQVESKPKSTSGESMVESDSDSAKKRSKHSDSGTLGRTGTMQGAEEIWVANSRLTSEREDDKSSSWDSVETSSERNGSFPPPPSALELGVDMAKSIKYMKGISEDHPVGSLMEKNLWKSSYESHSLDCLEEKEFGETSKEKAFKGHFRHQSTSAQKWRSEEIPKCQKPSDRLVDVNRRINEQLECYDQALRELAESSTPKNSSGLTLSSDVQNYHSLPAQKIRNFDDSQRTQNSKSKKIGREFFVDSGPHSVPYYVNTPNAEVENNETPGPEFAKPSENDPENLSGDGNASRQGEKLEKKTKRHMLLAMREVKHAVLVTNTFKSSVDDQILSPLTKPEGTFEMEGKISPKVSEGTSPGEENPFFALGRQETVLERNEFRRKSSSSGTGEEPTLWLQDNLEKKLDESDEDIPEIGEEGGGPKHVRASSFSPLGVIYKEIEMESQMAASSSPVGDSSKNQGKSELEQDGGEESVSPLQATLNGVRSQEMVREQSPDVSLSSGPIEPLGTEKDSGSEPESSHNDLTPTHNYSLKNQHEWLKCHLKTATSEKNKLEEIAAQLSERAERLQYELADAKEAAKSKDEVIQLLQGQLSRMEAAYTKSLEESVQSRLQLTSHEQEIMHLKELCYKIEEEKERTGGESRGNEILELEMKIKVQEEEKKKMRQEIIHLEQEKSSLEKRLKEVTDSEIIDQCQRWKERCEKLEEISRACDSKQSAYESYLKEVSTEHAEREKQLTERNCELERKYMEMSEKNIELNSKVESLASEIHLEKKKMIGKMDMTDSVGELKKRNLEMEVHMKNVEREMEERYLRKLKEKEEEVQVLVKQFNSERESLIMSYERRLMEGRSEHSEREVEHCKMENDRLKQMIKSLQDQVADIQMNTVGEETLKNDLSELKDQCNVVSKSIAEIQNKDHQELNSLLKENLKLKKEVNELKVKMIKDEEDVPNFKMELLGIVSENTKMKNEILDLKNQLNSLTVLLDRDRRLLMDSNLRNASLERRIQSASLERRQSQKSDSSTDLRGTRKRGVGKEDELAWNSLYGIKTTGRPRGERLSVNELLMRDWKSGEDEDMDEDEGKPLTSYEKEEELYRRLSSTTDQEMDLKFRDKLEFLELKKEILSLQNRMSNEKALRHALESQVAEINLDLRGKQNLEEEIHSLKRKIDRDCVQRSEMELINFQKELESKRERYLEGVEGKSTDDDYKAKCEMLTKEREKSKEIRNKMCRKSKSFDPGGQPSSEPGPPIRFHSYPLSQPDILVQSKSATIQPFGLEPEIKSKLEEELDKSIKKHITESSSTQSISSVQLELLKKKYLH